MSDFADIFDEWLTQTVMLRSLLGMTAEGPKHADPVPVDEIAVEHARRLVRDSDGREVVSETTLYVPDGKAAFATGDEVIIGGVTATVIRVADFEPFGLFDHKVVNLT
ncbi:head-to-tail stopper [Microbacterium phage Pickles13]|nr:head-to-tail stopper [Microbacterium phage Pickles13]